MTLVNRDHCYVPHKLRSRPLRCIILPIIGTILFILYWFVLCPLIYFGLCKMPHDWPQLWHFYFWITSFIIFLIILLIIVCLWRTKCRACPHSKKNQQNMDTEMKTVPFDSQDDKLKISLLDEKQNIDLETCIKPEVAEEAKEEVKISVENGPEKLHKPEKLNLSNEETSAQLHSPACPLTPREIFFWDLIQSANKCDSDNNSEKIHSVSIPSTPLYQDVKESDNDDLLLDGNGECNLPDDIGIEENDKCKGGDTGKSPTEPIHIIKSRLSVDLKKTDPFRNHSSSAEVGSPDREYFIASVSKRRSLTNEVYLYVDDGQDEKYLRIREADELKSINI